MSEPDSSNLASFYDPEHPDNHMMPLASTEVEYWVEITCDDGHTHGWVGYAHDAENAKDKAWDDATYWGYAPAKVELCQEIE